VVRGVFLGYQEEIERGREREMCYEGMKMKEDASLKAGRK